MTAAGFQTAPGRFAMALVCALFLGSFIAATSVRAEIKDYMILRLIYLNTSCGTQKLERIEPSPDGHGRFRIECRDVASYPNGILVTCSDSHDDRSCKINTPKKSFDSLNLMSPSRD